MAEAVIWAVSAIGAALGGTAGALLIMNAVAIAYTAILVGGLAYSSMQRKKAGQAAKDAYNSAQVDRLATVASTVAPRELCLGRVRKGGAPFFKASTGRDSQDLYIAIALAAHEIDAVEQIYLNDVLVELDEDGYVLTAPYARTKTLPAYTSTGGPYLPGVIPESILPQYRYNSDQDPIPLGVDLYQYQVQESFARVWWHLGAPGQVADATLMAAFPGTWSANEVGEGIAYLIIKQTYDETAFPSGAVRATAVLRGAKLYDPRTSTSVWSENPALMLRHVYTHSKFGKSTVSAAEDTRIIAAANACDTSTVYTIDEVAQPACPLYRGSLVVPYGGAPRDIFDDLAQAMGGSWAYSGGELHLKVGVYTGSVIALTESDLATVTRDKASETSRSITINVHKERSQKFNTVKVKIWDQAQDYKQVDLVPVVGAALITRDGKELTEEVMLSAVGYAPQAQHIAGVMMRDARDALTIEIPLKLTAYYLELFQTFSLSLPRYGWASKTFMVIGRSWTGDGQLLITGKETVASITQVDADFLPQGFASNTDLPKPWLIVGLGAVTAFTGTSELKKQLDGTVSSSMRLTWAQVADRAVVQNGHIDIRYRLSDSDGAWSVMTVTGDETSVSTSDIIDNAYYVIQGRTRTATAISDWNTQIQVRVLGKSEPPQDVPAFSIAGDTLNWTVVTDLDLAGYLLRFNYGSNFNWDAATPMHVGVITESPYILVTRPSGAVTLMIKAVDTSGNESLNAAAVATNLADPELANVVEVIDFDAEGYPGTLSGCTLVGGDLVADAAAAPTVVDYALIADAVTASEDYSLVSEAETATVDWSNLESSVAMSYITREVSITTALVGSLSTLSVGTQGDGVVIEYRLASPGPFYDADDEPFYGLDDDSLYGPPGPWIPWPGQLAMDNDTYQFRVQIAAGTVQGKISTMVLTIDAPDIEETIDDLFVESDGTVIPYTKNFTVIKNVQITLQTNGSGAETVEVDKTLFLSPIVRVYNSAHVGVSGASVDARIKGY